MFNIVNSKFYILVLGSTIRKEVSDVRRHDMNFIERRDVYGVM